MRTLWLLLLILILCTFSLAPFVWSVITSIKPPDEVTAIPPTYLPSEVSFENYTGVFAQRPFARYLLNSLIVALGSTALTLFAATLAAYALTRMRWTGAPIFEKGLLVFALFPPAILIVPLLTVARKVGASNSYVALMVVHAALNLPLAIWMLSAFFRQIPQDLEDAARVDGFSRLGMLSRVLVPLSAPAMAATAILVFIFSWNEFVIALMFMTQPAKQTLPVGISMLSGVTMYEIPWGQISAAIVMTTLPVVVAVLVMQRWILSGLTAGAIKG